jgi:hypothetical protein
MLAQPAATTAAVVKPTPNPSPAETVTATAVSRETSTQAAAAAPPDDETAFDDESQHLTHFILFNAVPSSIVSGVVHFIAFIVLALLTISPPQKSETLAINAAPPAEKNDADQLHEEKFNLALDSSLPEASESVTEILQNVVQATDTPTVAMDVDAAPIHIELSDFGEKTAPKNDLMATVGAAVGSGVSGRGAAERGMMVAKVGGTSESEAAVAAALKWLSEHQNQDGSWNFDHRTGPCNGRCSDPGSVMDCRTGATALGVLPFLGAGQTHQQGQYKHNVERALYFLKNQMIVRHQGGRNIGDLTGGTRNERLYAHGLCSIALCEAYAMTHDRSLMAPAQLSLNYIMWAQDPIGGGWRYAPHQPGDTSVVGWQLMALKSGHMAYLAVDPATIQGAIKYLDSVQADSGAKYGYTNPGQGQGTTGVGLLCRMYLGWKHENPALERGVKYLSNLGPKGDDIYANYYCTQVMRQYCGDPGTEGHEMWEKWNNKLRDTLVASQEKTGHQKGSWFNGTDRWAKHGGRLFYTSMATMILEVYYRHMPIYGKQAATDEFPL